MHLENSIFPLRNRYQRSQHRFVALQQLHKGPVDDVEVIQSRDGHTLPKIHMESKK